MVLIYVLSCQENKYYIGKTSDLDHRVQEHLTKLGSEWTTLYPPLEIVETLDNGDEFDEDKMTLKYMKKYGIENVRGGTFVSVCLEESDIKTLTKMLYSTCDACFKCGSVKHFAEKCPQVKKARRIAKRIVKKKRTFKKPKIYCFSCGKKDYTTNTCPTCNT